MAPAGQAEFVIYDYTISTTQRNRYHSMRSKAEAASVTGTVVNKIHSNAFFRLLVSQHRTHHPDTGACWRSGPLQGGHKVTSLQATCKRTVRGGCAARPRRSMAVSVWAGSRRAQSSNNFVFLPLPAKTTRFWPTRHKQCQPWARARRTKENTSLARSLTLTQHWSGVAGAIASTTSPPTPPSFLSLLWPRPGSGAFFFLWPFRTPRAPTPTISGTGVG